MKLICGPMATISHPAFRILIEKFGGCDEYFTEMINAGTLLTGGPFEKYYIDASPVPQKIVWQLTGHDTEKMIEAAKVLCELPGIGLDINMGCSAPDIYRFGAGISWMLKDIEETQKLVSGIRKVVPEDKRLSVKLRLGDENFTEDGFYSFCDMLVQNGVELLTLHPRTKKEKLARPPRYFYCENLALRYKDRIPVYLNGNVKDIPSYENAVKNCPSCAGVMISRAAVTKPWIFKEINLSQNKSENCISINMKDIAFEYIDNIMKYQPPEFWKTRLQRFFNYYAMNFKFSHYAQTQFLNALDHNDLRTKIDDFFEKCPEELIKNVTI